jgi:hypothetical protein
MGFILCIPCGPVNMLIRAVLPAQGRRDQLLPADRPRRAPPGALWCAVQYRIASKRKSEDAATSCKGVVSKCVVETPTFPYSTVSPQVRAEPMTGIEPAYSAWEADVLPLNYIGATAPKG